MSKVEIKDRIKEALKIREITQTELATKANIDKGQLSSYISGKYKPRQNNIDALAIALNVNEAWLMGFDVPIERVQQLTDGDIGNAFSYDSLEVEIDSMKSLSPNEKNHLKAYIQLWEVNRKKVDDYTKQLLSIQQMENDVALAAAHERTDIEVTEDMRKHDDDIMDDDNF